MITPGRYQNGHILIDVGDDGMLTCHYREYGSLVEGHPDARRRLSPSAAAFHRECVADGRAVRVRL